MAILIKDMEMPETCDECDFHIYHSNGEYICVATPLLYPWNLANYKGGRKEWCPLVEVQDSQTEKKYLNGDVIDRQAAITIPILPSWNRKYQTFNLDDAYELGWDDCQKCIEALPSAQPETYKEKLNEIASALSEKFAYMNTCSNERDIILGYLGVKRCCSTHCNTDCTNTKCESHPLSSAQPDIVHCRDCKHRGEKPIADGRYWCEIHDTFMYYCSDAERRTDE